MMAFDGEKNDRHRLRHRVRTDNTICNNNNNNNNLGSVVVVVVLVGSDRVTVDLRDIYVGEKKREKERERQRAHCVRSLLAEIPSLPSRGC